MKRIENGKMSSAVFRTFTGASTVLDDFFVAHGISEFERGVVRTQDGVPSASYFCLAPYVSFPFRPGLAAQICKISCALEGRFANSLNYSSAEHQSRESWRGKLPLKAHVTLLLKYDIKSYPQLASLRSMLINFV